MIDLLVGLVPPMVS